MRQVADHPDMTRTVIVRDTTGVPDPRSGGDADALLLLRSSDHPLVHSFPHGAVIVFDHDLRYLSAGGLGLAEVGLSREALEGKTIFEAFPLETSTAIEPLYRAALAGECTTFDVPYAGRIFTQRLAPILSSNGTVLAGMGFTQDVTEQRESERRLRESEQRFRLAFEHAPIGKAIVGLDGLFREVNPALCRLTGYPAERLLALTFQDITHPDDLDADLTLLGQLVKGEIPNYTLEKRYYTAAGGLVWVLLHVSLVVGDDCEPLYLVAQIQDITDRKRTEQDLQERHTAEAAALQYTSLHDALTGLPNRRLLEQRLADLLNPAERRQTGQRIALLFCDLDGFKTLNDELGHEAGDVMLRQVAERLVEAARASDTVARLGGDEFVVLINARTDEDVRSVAAGVAKRICNALSTPLDGLGSTAVTASIGIAVSGSRTDPIELLREADAAMYQAKRGGKNGYVFYASRW
jgi:diguanylate cyclase (GGDEF)-like protein/PAS domain S-box-containing protein